MGVLEESGERTISGLRIERDGGRSGGEGLAAKSAGRLYYEEGESEVDPVAMIGFMQKEKPFFAG